MRYSWRWFGPDDPVALDEIRQTGATDIVSALHHIPNGQVWPIDEIAKRRSVVEAAGLMWSVVESVPIVEEIKRGGPNRDAYIEAYQQTLRNLAACGIDVVCYNFLPILDWVRTDLGFELSDGSWALRYEHKAFVAFDLFVLCRPEADQDYDPDEVAAAREFYDTATPEAIEELTQTILAGLPGSEESFSLESLRESIARYEGVDAAVLRRNLVYFLDRVIPVAEEAGIRMGIHADDPPWPLLGIPRIISTAEDVRWLLEVVPSPASGLTFCAGSYAERPDNDVPAMAQEFSDRIYFAHLRSVGRLDGHGPRDFYEADHIGGESRIAEVMRELLREESRTSREDRWTVFVRPDHGHQILDDKRRSTRPGYPLIGRMKGLSELRGVDAGLRLTL